jgi:uncharacterized protein (DUF2236 family)
MPEHLFSPDNLLWRVHRETVLVAVGGRALLMQIAHPKVAAGVAQHSDFRYDPLLRLRRTLTTMWSVVFDEADQARAALARVKAIHTKVRGTLGESGGAPTNYDALDPQLLLWVHATLVDSALLAYDRFVARMTGTEKSQYYEETKKLAALFDIPAALIPPCLPSFYRYMARMLDGGEVRVSATGRALARDILRPTPWLLRPIRPLFAFVTTGLLPAPLRDGYGLEWDERRERRLERLAVLTRVLLPGVPAPLRFVPNARASEKRLSAQKSRAAYK